MLDSLIPFLQALNSLSPLGVIALLVVVVLLMVHEKGPVKKLMNNHLDHVQMALDKIVVNGSSQIELLNEIKSEISYLKGKLDK